jgi:hypothetical protein
MFRRSIPWSRQPQVRARIASKWRGAVGFASFTGLDDNRPDLVTGEVPTRTGTFTRVPNQFGIAAKSDSTSARYSFASANPVKSVSDGYAILVIAAPIAGSTARRTLVLGPETDPSYTACTFAFNLNANSGAAAVENSCLFEYSGASFTRVDSTQFLNNGTLQVYLANRLPGSGTPQLFINGINRTAQTFTTASTFTVPAGVHVHSSAGASSNAGIVDPVLFVAVFRRALSVGEAATLSSPAAVFRELLAPRQIIVPVGVAGGALPTLTSVSASDITSSGFKPQVTYTF